MKCQKCNQREATTHLTKVINGDRREYHLCSECANESDEFKAEFNSAFDTDFGFGSFFGSMLKDFGMPSMLGSSLLGGNSGGQSSRVIPALNSKCDQCGTTFEEFSRNGQIGCPNCYKAFGNRLSSPLKQFHGNTEHIGKIPSSHKTEIGINKRIKQLESELNQDVANQNFEHAAVLRDEIKKLREQL